MARGVRLEVRAYACSVEDAFNLAVHKMRLLVANDLDFLVVPHAAVMDSFRQGHEMLRSHVRVKHITRELSIDEVRGRTSSRAWLEPSHAWLEAGSRCRYVP